MVLCRLTQQIMAHFCHQLHTFLHNGLVGGKIGVQTEQFRPMGKDKRRKQWYIAKWLETTNFKGQERKR